MAVITGAGSGFGRGCAISLADARPRDRDDNIPVNSVSHGTIVRLTTIIVTGIISGNVCKGPAMIERVETIPLRVPLQHGCNGSYCKMRNRCTNITPVHTSDGVVGECCTERYRVDR